MAGWLANSLWQYISKRTKPMTFSFESGYLDVIEKPMDLGTIRSKLESGSFASLSDFHQDMMLVKSNCETFNPEGHPVYKDCMQVSKIHDKHVRYSAM